MGLPTPNRSPAQRRGNLAGVNGAPVSDQLLEKARADTETVLRELESRLDGLTQAEANSRLKQYGLNEIAREKRQSALMRLLSNVKNPLVLLLTALGVLSFLTGDLRARRSPVRKESTPSAVSRRTNGFLTLLRSRISAD